ncbi:Uncharacterized protein dnm_053490 [Desulfonema magnum]|uniref:Uncharacterized protein n=1 Tax=Desulfonema magnum TaxID=45655 RepID=A0A975BP56_9BACT|nr:Uncharacterized protein dnm_053490 [Desulfonema magnum]
MIIECQQIEKFPDCARCGKETRLFSRTFRSGTYFIFAPYFNFLIL